jgi:hypothetical protein
MDQPITGATDEDQGHDSTDPDHFQIPFQKKKAGAIHL